MKDDPAATPPRHGSRKAAIISVGILTFLVLATCACFSCFTYLEYQKQAILNRQRDLQQTLLDKTLDAIRVWRLELVNQARFISSSEMFRIYIADTRDLSREKLDLIRQHESLHSGNAEIRGLAEQRIYMEDLLADLVRRRSWEDARIVSVAGEDILTRESSKPVSAIQKDMAERAAKEKRVVFGPIINQNGSIYMDMADPLFEVLGTEDPKAVAVLLLRVPMEKPLVSFLSDASQQSAIVPFIVDQSPAGGALARLAGKNLSLKPLQERVSDGALPFGIRPSLGSISSDSSREAWSLGGEPTMLNWLLVLETPATIINERIRTREWEIYGLGALATIGLTLLAAFLFAQFTSRQHKARAAHLNQLYNTIRQQKLVLDGVNKSLNAGILLANDHAVILMANPAFAKLAGMPGEDLYGQPLMDVLPANAAMDLISNMKNVIESGQFKTIEMCIPEGSGKEERLFRVNLFPYQSEKGESTSSGSGCVATFQDITVFRANARKAAQRQEALLIALDRGIESVDPNLVGHAAKMATVSGMLSDELGLDQSEKETLRIASLLSQVGKLFVPREILLKKGKLTEEENRELGKAPEHANRILRDLNFDLPVRETVAEMSERLDGSGIMGLKAGEISRAGRVLGIVNAFIAMTSPRAWRNEKGMSVAEAIDILMKDARFDQQIVAVLKRLDRDKLQSGLTRS